MTGVRERLTPVGDRVVRSLRTGPVDADHHVVVLPGLGLLGYLLPFARALAARGVGCSLLDLPGFGTRGPPVVEPTVEEIATAAADWLRCRPQPRGTALMGHSTGAQAALRAALAVQDDLPLRSVVLAGATFAPRQRSVLGVLAAGALAYRRDSPRELVVAGDLLRHGARVTALIRDAQHDRPEGGVAHLRGRVLLTAGRADSLVPPDWLATLAGSAHQAGSVHVVRLPGSHNNPWTQPRLLAGLVASHLAAGVPGA